LLIICSRTWKDTKTVLQNKMNRLLQATNFAAKKHSMQRRKNAEASPYINHPVEVALHLSDVGKVEDEDILIAALLHDTIEDTETTREEIVTIFGDSVASLVCECTDDKILPKLERKRLQIENAPKKSSGAKQIKIADKTCNLRSILIDPPADWSIHRQFEYFQWAEKVIAGLLGVNQKLDQEVCALLQQGLDKLK
jgi:guanosine-3',5'-bis(diphosphate) 3'-pyrophosphohydrolase